MTHESMPGYDPIEEVDRKTVDELQRVMHAVSTARMPVTQAFGALKALWATCSGIAHKETMDLVSNACNALEAKLAMDDKPDASISMYGDSRVYLIKRRGSCVQIKLFGPNGESIQQVSAEPSEVNPELWAQKRLNSIAEKLTLKGIRRIA